MSDHAVSNPGRPRQLPLRSMVGFGAGTLALLTALAQLGPDRIGAYAAWTARGFGHPHAPHLAPLINAGPVVLTHVVTVLAALIIGTILMLGVKGNLLHRTLGWMWVMFMILTAATSLFIHIINPGAFSFIHIFSALVLIQAPLGVFFAKRHNVKGHRQTMTGLFIGAILVAGFFTFLPGRIMWQVFFG
jgi:uncharacterized membrane protein